MFRFICLALLAALAIQSNAIDLPIDIPIVSDLLDKVLDLPAKALKDLTDVDINEHFGKFSKAFKKNYKDKGLLDKAMKTFGDNLKRALSLAEKVKKDPKRHVEFGINQYFDLTNNEFADKLLTKTHPAGNDSAFLNLDRVDVPRSSRFQSIPASFDWRNTANVVGPVRNQGGCGCCWAFTVAAVTQSVYGIKNKKLIQPSEAQLCDCGMGQAGCNGGYFSKAFQYVKDKGISVEASYPLYTDTRGNSYSSCQDAGKPNTLKVSSFAIINPRDEPTMQSALVQYGPLAVAMKVGESFRYYKSGTFYDFDCEEDETFLGWHAITLVGYGTDSDGWPYWTIKNSWSTGWGMAGYMNLLRGWDICMLESSDTTYARP